jgi:hypothetical protein
MCQQLRAYRETQRSAYHVPPLRMEVQLNPATKLGFTLLSGVATEPKRLVNFGLL